MLGAKKSIRTHHLLRVSRAAFLCPSLGGGLWWADDQSHPSLPCAHVRNWIGGVPEGIDQFGNHKQREDSIAHCRSPTFAHQPAGAREIALPASAPVQSGGLVPLGRRTICQSP